MMAVESQALPDLFLKDKKFCETFMAGVLQRLQTLESYQLKTMEEIGKIKEFIRDSFGNISKCATEGKDKGVGEDNIQHVNYDSKKMPENHINVREDVGEEGGQDVNEHVEMADSPEFNIVIRHLREGDNCETLETVYKFFEEGFRYWPSLVSAKRIGKFRCNYARLIIVTFEYIEEKELLMSRKKELKCSEKFNMVYLDDDLPKAIRFQRYAEVRQVYRARNEGHFAIYASGNNKSEGNTQPDVTTPEIQAGNGSNMQESTDKVPAENASNEHDNAAAAPDVLGIGSIQKLVAPDACNLPENGCKIRQEGSAQKTDNISLREMKLFGNSDNEHDKLCSVVPFQRDIFGISQRGCKAFNKGHKRHAEKHVHIEELERNILMQYDDLIKLQKNINYECAFREKYLLERDFK